MFESHHDAEEGNAADEGLSAVDGVEIPFVVGCALLDSEFFSDDGVLRDLLGQAGS